MKLAVITPGKNISLVERSFSDLAKDAAARMYPQRSNLLGPDRDKQKRDQAEKAIYDALLQIGLEVAKL